MKNKFRFESLPWDSPTKGVKQKIIPMGDKQLRLVRFDYRFIETDWCTLGHSGFILEGEMKIEFETETNSYSKGDALHIQDTLKHKAIIGKGKFVEILLFENKSI